MAFADGFDAAYSLKHDLQKNLKRSVDILIYTDSLSLFNIITKSSKMAEMRLMIDLVVVREEYDCMKNRAARVPSHQLEPGRCADQGQSQHVPGDHPDDRNN
jgi:hypothetical protein